MMKENDGYDQVIKQCRKSNHSREKQVWRITRNLMGNLKETTTLWDEDPREEEAIFMFHPVHVYQ